MRAILTYHSIDPSGSPISLDEETFGRHVAWLASGAVRVVSVGELLALPPGDAAVALTFDDGFESFASRAWPLLRERGLPATLFVATDRVGHDNAWGGRAEPGIPTLPLLGWDALASLANEGLALGSHSVSHRRLDRLGQGELRDEVERSAEVIEGRTGARCESFCYPYGAHDEGVVAAARGRYANACTTELNVLPHPCVAHRLPRLDAFYYRAPGRLEAWGGVRFRAHLTLRRTARGLRQGLRRER